MKKIFILGLLSLTAACSSLIPYKDQNLDYLQGIEKDPNAYRGQVVSFGGEVKGITEDTLRLRLVLKIDAPLYYYATGKGSSISYELILVTFNKRGLPAMTGIKKGNEIKVLARVSSYETRKNFTGKDIAVLHLIAFAINNHTAHKDFFRPETPDRQLYESWKSGRLFFEESAQEVIDRYPVPAGQDMPVPIYIPQDPPTESTADSSEPEKGIVFDEEEPPFIVAPETAPLTATTAGKPAKPETQTPKEKSSDENQTIPLSPNSSKEEEHTSGLLSQPSAGQSSLAGTLSTHSNDPAMPETTDSASAEINASPSGDKIPQPQQPTADAAGEISKPRAGGSAPILAEQPPNSSVPATTPEAVSLSSAGGN